MRFCIQNWVILALYISAFSFLIVWVVCEWICGKLFFETPQLSGRGTRKVAICIRPGANREYFLRRDFRVDPNQLPESIVLALYKRGTIWRLQLRVSDLQGHRLITTPEPEQLMGATIQAFKKAHRLH
ncbi:MAG: hypothetical protein NTZ80_03685 [Patescibacteria group bacterium]|nr:hypothetical protein [Patescibacteria group bacterium]